MEKHSSSTHIKFNQRELKIITNLSKRLVYCQKDIRILDAIKWTDEIKASFFDKKFKKLPKIDKRYYEKKPLPFDVTSKTNEFHAIINDSRKKMGQYSIITRLIEPRCLDYIKVINMLANRGTRLFSGISKELYGSPEDSFYLGGPNLSQLGSLLAEVLANLKNDNDNDTLAFKQYTALEAQKILFQRLSQYFCDEKKGIKVKISDDIVADAAAGADVIKLNKNSHFSERDLKYLEVHEGWVHVGTTLNGSKQPYCSFLSKGSPASTVTQEGLAVITEVFTFNSYPDRLTKLTNRIRAIDMANDGADFIDIFRFFQEQGYDEDTAYSYTVRIFRGSSPKLGPFTKDLSYLRGFMLIYNYIRLAVKQGIIDNIPLLFCGKAQINEIKLLAQLEEEGLISRPVYLPPQFKDLSALSSWMSLSLYLNKFDLAKMESLYGL